MQRWIDVGFTSAQAELLNDLVTKDYLHEEFVRHKRSMLLWQLVMQAPVYAALIYIAMKLGV